MSLSSGTSPTMRLATFNILNGRTASDDQVELGVFRDAVASLDADVLALQEVDRNQPRSGRTDLTAARDMTRRQAGTPSA